MIQIRSAKQSEIDWINRCYDEVEFMHSNFDNEVIAIAELNGQKAGLGRLVTIDDQHLELGGMYVFESFRGKGIAKKIVQFLLDHVKPSQKVYCIPFEHLLNFYKQCGFTTCSNLKTVPPKLLEKYQWCKEKYKNPTALLVLKKSNR